MLKKYQDYVIKDGKFVGKFEEMYTDFEDPWNQKAFVRNIYSFSRNASVLNLKRYKIKSVVEFGCGLGYYTATIARNVKDIKIAGIDISTTAIEKAKKLHPHLDFRVDNIVNIGRYSDYEAILFAEITWYILDNLDKIFQKMLAHFKGKYFLHNLVFYKNGIQEYGRNFFTTLEEFIEYVPFELMGYSEATIMDSDSIETSAIFKIKRK